MNRPLRLWIAVAAVTAAGGLFACAFIFMDSVASPGGAMRTLALLPAGGVAISSTGSVGSVSHPAHTGAVVVTSYRDAAARAGPSVVTVHSNHTSKGLNPLAPSVLVKGLGSGVIVDRDGYIVTNHHVIEGASQLAVALPDGTLHLARVVGTDPESDIALLKIDIQGLSAITPADINDVAVGDVVLALGNPLGVGQTVTQGIVSAVVRKGMNPVENFIQTDAAINPGNSGGALIDTAGRLVGINVAMLSHSGGSEGIGFAIPVDYVQTVAWELKATGRVARGWLGVSTAASLRGEGALVVAVERDGPADRAGIAPGDIIVRIGEKPVTHAQDARSVVIGAEPGGHLPIEFVRNGKREARDVELARVPPQRAR